jgi:hypothetical protein
MELTLRRIPIGGWVKCVHEAAAFESKGEFSAATLLDTSQAIIWWLRNDPPVIRIPSPLGWFEPDFVYLAARGKDAIYGLLEVKGEVFWDGEGSEARVKAAAATEWVEALDAAGPRIKWEFAVVLDQDAINAKSFEGLVRCSLAMMPGRQHKQL